MVSLDYDITYRGFHQGWRLTRSTLSLQDLAAKLKPGWPKQRHEDSGPGRIKRDHQKQMNRYGC